MFVVQTAQARRLRKSVILVALLLLASGSPLALYLLFTMHVYVRR